MKYSAERVLEILLNQDIAKDRICMKKPSGITCSASYVVDVRTLDCLDDIKKDEFGIWNYSGSHPRGFRVFHKMVLLEAIFSIYAAYIALIHQMLSLNV